MNPALRTIQECTERWASALCFAPLVRDIFHDEIKRAARELMRQGKGAFLFDYQLSDLSTHWRDEEIEEECTIKPGGVAEKQKAMPLVPGVLYRKGKPTMKHATRTRLGDLCAEVRTWCVAQTSEMALVSTV